MTTYLVKGFPDLLDKPGGTAIDGLTGNMIVVGTGNVSGDFIEVKVDDQTGWVAKESLAVKGRDLMNEVSFVRECLIAERAVNMLPQTTPWFVSADYVIARAIFETQDTGHKMVNADPKIPGSDGVGPCQISTAEWKRFLDNGGDLAAGFGTGSVDDYLAQAWGAAFTMFTDAKAITQAKRAAGEGSDAEPPLPSYLEIFLAYLTGSPKVAIALAAAAATPADKGQDPAAAAPAAGTDGASKLNDFLKTKAGLADDQIAALFKARPGLTGTNDANAKTVADFVNGVSARFAQGLKDAFDLINKHAPETIAAVVGSGKAPWFDIARQEEGKHIKEGVGNSDAEILKYFQSINFPTSTSQTPWCAAFVSFCMKTCGDPVVAASVPKTNPALAASWKNWGDALPINGTNTPPGAVVVLAPTENHDVSGHVALYVRGDANTITLLGGNQSDAVKESTYARSRVAAIRWLDVAGPAAGPAAVGNINLSHFNAQQQDAAKIIIKAFADAGFGRLHQITAVANAWRESSLDPGQETHTSKEDSIGLFQLNMRSGLGVGHALGDLRDALKNTNIIVGVCKTVPSFVKATDLEQAVTAFVRFVERPANQPAEIADRLHKANSLMA
ncbi:TIGR02594 family protein [Bradyrhizobium stylosanthis]|uniref:Uncharacterized protein (TIGR02594 family) n=1 Tax=Bradyrhizobium stylosanthis TaxID=1803665 RepID=A0A560DG00_9BRAD|nr:TIGR02594 family protein [Bradyrhizobium stylosanthis]TWA95992.1 uncharacterized protein (TIGR02594 family) [Bradyrhizobium stylosanthis]